MHLALTSAVHLLFWLAVYDFVPRWYNRVLPTRSSLDRWKSSTRTIALGHAALVSVSGLFVVFRDTDLLTSYDYQGSPELRNSVLNINALMLGYLTVDGFYLVTAKVEPTWKVTGLHHFAGAVSMIMFLVNQRFLFNSLFYALTEFSTIFLHLSWFALHENALSLAAFCAIVTWLLFLTIRLGGGIGIAYLYYLNYAALRQESWLIYAFAVGGNGLLSVLNVTWFYQLTVSIAARIRSRV